MIAIVFFFLGWPGVKYGTVRGIISSGRCSKRNEKEKKKKENGAQTKHNIDVRNRTLPLFSVAAAVRRPRRTLVNAAEQLFLCLGINWTRTSWQALREKRLKVDVTGWIFG